MLEEKWDYGPLPYSSYSPAPAPGLTGGLRVAGSKTRNWTMGGGSIGRLSAVVRYITVNKYQSMHGGGAYRLHRTCVLVSVLDGP